MIRINTLRTLADLDACGEALIWLEDQPTWATAWKKCTRGDWMAWLLGRISGEANSPDRQILADTLEACLDKDDVYKWLDIYTFKRVTKVRDAADWAASILGARLPMYAKIIRKHYPKPPTVRSLACVSL